MRPVARAHEGLRPVSAAWPAASSSTPKVKRAKKLLDAARRREIDLVLVWRLDRWGSLTGSARVERGESLHEERE